MNWQRRPCCHFRRRRRNILCLAPEGQIGRRRRSWVHRNRCRRQPKVISVVAYCDRREESEEQQNRCPSVAQGRSYGSISSWSAARQWLVGHSFELRRQYLPVRITILGIPGETPRNNRVERARKHGIDVCRRRDLSLQYLCTDGLHRIALEGPLPGSQLVEDDSEREEIRSAICRLTFNLFWREVCRSPSEAPIL